MVENQCQWKGCRSPKFNQGLTTNYCRTHMEKFCDWEGCNDEAIIDPDSGRRKYCSIHHKSKIKLEQSEFIAQLERRDDLDSITISTGGLDSNYRIIDSIMVFDYDVAGLIKGTEPANAFELVKEHMREVAIEKGGDAVINCQFQFRFAVAPKLLFWAQAFELYAYGTVVKRLE